MRGFRVVSGEFKAGLKLNSLFNPITIPRSEDIQDIGGSHGHTYMGCLKMVRPHEVGGFLLV